MTLSNYSLKSTIKVVSLFTILLVLSSKNVLAKSNNLEHKASTISHQEIAKDTLKQRALIVLQNKCNTCHKKRNPFLIFKEKNMDRRAKRVYKQVFELKRMPKKDGTPLTKEEYATLKLWIESI